MGIGSILGSLCYENFILMLTFRFNVLFKKMYSMLKFWFTNVEEYWNIYEIAKVEKKHNYPATWFIGINSDKKKPIFDYDFDDKDLMKDLKDLTNNDSEMALLYKSKDKSIEKIQKDFDILMSKLSIRKSGVRHLDFFTETENLDKHQHEKGFKYDSSRFVKVNNSFYNGFALPYPSFTSLVTGNPHTIQFPISFSDELLMIKKYKFLPLIDAMTGVKEAISKVKKARGLYHVSFSNSLYSDIPYMPRLFEYIVDQFNDQKAFVATCSAIVEWLFQRYQMNITEKDNKIIIKFLADIEQITFEILGKKAISNVFGGNSSHNDNMVMFTKVFKGLEVEIDLIDTVSE